MLDVREVARLAHRSQETVRRWVWSGKVRARKDGNRLLIRRDDVARLTGTDDEAAGERALTLAEWRDGLPQARGVTSSGSAADLVIGDRRARSEQQDLGRAGR